MNNEVIVRGVLEDLNESHQHGSEKFYRGSLRAKRPSGSDDVLPIIVSQYIHMEPGKEYTVLGSLRTKNIEAKEGEPSKLIYIFVTELPDTSEVTNIVRLTGNVVNAPELRVVKSQREVAGCVLKVKHPQYDKFWYIPVVFWGRQAKWASENLTVGKELTVEGRFQSRDYTKVVGNRKNTYTINEVSVTGVN